MRVSLTIKCGCGWIGRQRLDFRSPSLELAKIQVSPGFFPNFDPSGSVLITCSMAFPTSPEPPVTRTTSPVVMIVKKLKDRNGLRYGRRFTVIENREPNGSLPIKRPPSVDRSHRIPGITTNRLCIHSTRQNKSDP